MATIIATVIIIIIIEAVCFIYLICEILTQPCKVGIIHPNLPVRGSTKELSNLFKVIQLENTVGYLY